MTLLQANRFEQITIAKKLGANCPRSPFAQSCKFNFRAFRTIDIPFLVSLSETLLTCVDNAKVIYHYCVPKNIKIIESGSHNSQSDWASSVLLIRHMKKCSLAMAQFPGVQSNIHRPAGASKDVTKLIVAEYVEFFESPYYSERNSGIEQTTKMPGGILQYCFSNFVIKITKDQTSCWLPKRRIMTNHCEL